MDYAYILMKTNQKYNLEPVIKAALEKVGADALPTSVGPAVNDHLFQLCADLIRATVDKEYVGKMTQQFLEPTAAANSATSTGGAL